MKVLVTGSRKYSDKENVFSVLDALHFEEGISLVIHGAATGADHFAHLWAKENNILDAPHPADWDQYGRAAGPIRNRQMLIEEEPDLVVAFPGGAGTKNMIDQALKRNFKVQLIEK